MAKLDYAVLGLQNQMMEINYGAATGADAVSIYFKKGAESNFSSNKPEPVVDDEEEPVEEVPEEGSATTEAVVLGVSVAAGIGAAVAIAMFV